MLIVTKSRFILKNKFITKLKVFIIKYPKNKIFLGFTLSLIRYFVFSFQFYFLLLIFKIDISYLNTMMVITTIYLLASIIPSIFIFDVIIKGSIAVYLCSYIPINEITILSIITIMWLLNFVLPSIFGSYYILNFNFPKTNKTDDII